MDAGNPLGYGRIATGSAEGIQGGISPAPPQSHNFVQLFIAVDDVKAFVRKAGSLGATPIIPPTLLPQGNELAVLHDPHGMPFGVWRSK